MSDPKTALAIVPRSVAEARDLAGQYAKSSLLPPDLRGKEADVFVTIMAGLELGLAPMASLRSIHVVKGKPILSADAMVAVVQASGLCEYFTCVESSAAVATYETKRKGAPPPQRLSFSLDEAKMAKLTGGDNWMKYPAAMLRARAKAALARDVYPDAIAGVYTDDEAAEFTPPRPHTNGSTIHFSPPADVVDAEVVSEEPGVSFEDRLAAAAAIADLAPVAADLKKLPHGEERKRLAALYCARRDVLLRGESP